MQWTLSARLQGVYMYLYFSVNICKTVPYMYTYVHTQSVLIYLKHFFCTLNYCKLSFYFISDRATPSGAARQIYRHERDGSAGSK